MGHSVAMTDKTALNLLGKDYFTEIEAAHYAGVSPRQFRKKAMESGIMTASPMGKKLYRKDDIQRVLELSFTKLTVPH